MVRKFTPPPTGLRRCPWADVQQILLPIFRPNADISDVVDKEMSQYKEQGYFIIGVHIRRGDYKTWEGGQASA